MKTRLFATALLLLTLVVGCTQNKGNQQEGNAQSQYGKKADLTEQITTEKYESQYFDLFDTFISFSAFTGSREEFERYDAIVYTELERLHQLFDVYNTYEGVNNLKTINDNAGIAPVAVDASVIDLLLVSVQAYEDTGGAVNVAMGPVLRLWHEVREAAETGGPVKLPDLKELSQAARHTDLSKIVIDTQNSTVFLPEPEMALDVGAIAKGYAAQKAVDKAVEAGFSSGILNAGGNVVVVGSPADGRETWSVGVQEPQMNEDGTQELFDALSVSGPVSVVTSGDYQRYFEIDGKKYHHIIDPDTLMPAEQANAVTVVYHDSTMADILSTAVFILPYERGRALVESAGAEAVWIWNDGTVKMTEGYPKISREYQQ